MPTLKDPVPQIYDEALKRLRTASASKADEARLNDMTIFRSHVLSLAATSRAAAAQPTKSDAHTKPPNSYDEALKARRNG